MQNEVWKDIEGYEGIYQVSNLGRIKSLDRKVRSRWGLMKQKGIVLKSRICNGYVLICLSKNGKNKDVSVHRVIAKSWVPGRTDAKNEVNHIDGDKTNNSVDNLEWCDRRHNIQHSIRIGLRTRQDGAGGYSAILTEKEVKEIRELKKNNPTISQPTLGRMFGISKSEIGYILNRAVWKNI